MNLDIARTPLGSEIEMAGGDRGEAAKLLLTGVHNGLPDGLAAIRRRPDQMRRPKSYSDSTVAARHISIDSAR